MKNRSPWVLLGLVMAGSVALATSTRHLRTDLTGFEEVPPVSTTGSGHLRLVVFPDNNAIHYELSYSALESDATQAHIHFGQMGVNGGISAFLLHEPGQWARGHASLSAAQRQGDRHDHANIR